MFDLTGRVALVTGAGQGVGTGIAESLVAAGAAVAVNDLHPDRAESTARALSSEGARVTAVPFDVTDRAAVVAGIAAVQAELGPIDVLVNNAGIPASMRPVPFREMGVDEWAPYVDVNLYGVLDVTKAVIDGMCDRGFGRVVTISSGAGTTGLGIGVSLYAAGKGAAISFMRHLAVECAARGVTANTVALGLMERDGMEGSITEKMAASIPVGRLGTGADAGAACVYLASDEAGWFTGQTIGLNGGAVTS